MVRDLLKVPERARAVIKLPAKALERLPDLAHVHHISKKTARLTVEIAIGLVLLASLAAGFFYWRLSQGPISISSLREPLQNAINQELQGLRITVKDAIVQRSESGAGIVFRLTDARLTGPGGQLVAKAPLAAIGLSGLALIKGRLAPSRIELIGPRFTLAYNAKKTEQGAGKQRESIPLRPSVHADMGPTESATVDLLQAAAGVLSQVRSRRNATAFLSEFGVSNAVIVLEGADKPVEWVIPQLFIRLDEKGEERLITGAASVAAEPGPWQLEFSVKELRDVGRIGFTGKLKDFTPSALAENLPAAALLRNLEMPVSAAITADLDLDGSLIGAEMGFDLSAGHIRLPWQPEDPVLIDEGKLRLRYSRATGRLEIEPSTIHSGESHGTFTGSIREVERTDGGVDWAFDLKALDAVLASEEFGGTPIPAESIVLRGKYDTGAGNLTLDDVRLQAGEADIRITGEVNAAPGSPEVRLDVKVGAMSIPVLKQVWPTYMAPDVREWFGLNVTKGRFLGGNVKIGIPAGLIAKLSDTAPWPDDVVDMRFTVDNAFIKFLKGMPALRAEKAVGRLKGGYFSLDVEKGDVSLPSGGKVRLVDGRFEVPNVRQEPAIGGVTLIALGSTKEVLELIDQPALGFSTLAGVNPAKMGGVVQVRLGIGFPLIGDVGFHHVAVKAAARIEKLYFPGFLGDIDADDGAVDLEITHKEMSAHGDVSLAGIPASFDWRRSFADKSGKSARFRMAMTLGDEERRKLNLGLGNLIEGPASVVLTGDGQSRKTRSIHISADLTESVLELRQIGWRKPAGADAQISLALKESPDKTMEITDLRLVGKDIDVAGSLTLDENRKLASLDFPRMNMSRKTNISVSGRRNADGLMTYNVSGAAFDGRSFFRSLLSPVDAGNASAQEEVKPASEDFILNASIDTVHGHYGTRMDGAKIKLRRQGGQLVEADVSGKIDGKTPVKAVVKKEKGKPRTLVAESLDAGGLFRLVGFYPRVHGGRTALKINLDGQGAVDTIGVLFAQNFSVRNEPAMRELLAGLPDDRIAGKRKKKKRSRKKQQNVYDPDNVVFKRLRVPFSIGNGKFVLHNSYMNGPALGATLRGAIDFRRGAIEINGTYVPAYEVNSFFGKVPILGGLLVGRRGEGLLGVTFAVRGPLKAPVIIVNPVSAVAPGFLRQLFEFQKPGASTGKTSDWKKLN